MYRQYERCWTAAMQFPPALGSWPWWPSPGPWWGESVLAGGMIWRWCPCCQSPHSLPPLEDQSLTRPAGWLTWPCCCVRRAREAVGPLLKNPGYRWTAPSEAHPYKGQSRLGGPGCLRPESVKSCGCSGWGGTEIKTRKRDAEHLKSNFTVNIVDFKFNWNSI